jgi:NADH-quinone oxidoreductase subunit J
LNLKAFAAGTGARRAAAALRLETRWPPRYKEPDSNVAPAGKTPASGARVHQEAVRRCVTGQGMDLAAIAFYVLSAIVIASAFAVISVRNPVHAVLCLILTFCTAAGLFVLLGAEFLAMLLVVVYVGAVAVLFLFVVMMLDVDFVELRQGFLAYLPIGAIVALVLLVELGLVAGASLSANGAPIALPPVGESEITNAEAIGRVLYTEHLLLFQLAGLVLFLAMIGAIVLTLRHRPGVRRQNIAKQVGRRRSEGVELKDVRPGQGLG